ncbi:MAG: DUF2267 domain-containing protein [Bacteroidales bacterium]|nr:DUF2267 domain-containing protein [Bacteroidales bacterium]
MALNFDKYAQEGNSFLKELARNLGHPDEIARTGIILKAVLHTLRDRITIGESLNLISTLPMFLKAVYVENWKNRDKPLQLKTKREFADEVKKTQNQFGERDFDWKISTEEIINTVFFSLRKYIPEGESEDVIAQLPNEIKELLKEKIQH